MWLMLLLVLAARGAACPGAGSGPAPPPRVSCRALGLTALPPLHDQLLELDVSSNNISSLAAGALLPAQLLRDLNLSANRLQAVAPGALTSGALLRLWLRHCALRRLPPLDLPALQLLDASDNQLSELSRALLPPLPQLRALLLKRNRIAYIADDAFANAPDLRVLRLEENLLMEIPPALQALPLLEELSLAANAVGGAGAGALVGCARLARLELAGNPLQRLHARALDGLPRLTELSLSECRGLRVLPALNGSRRLRALRADRAALHHVSPDLCRHAPRLKELDLKSNRLERVPDLEECSELRVLALSSNRISSLDDALHGLERLQDLLLARNRIRRLPAGVFQETPHLQLLDLEDNQIEYIDLEAFLPIKKLEDLNVGNNEFPSLPAGGLQQLRHLKAHNNPRLRRFHPPALFPRIQTLVLSYAYHCCEYMAPAEGEDGGEGQEEDEGLSDTVLLPPRVDPAAWANATDIYALYLNATGGRGAGEAVWGARAAPQRVHCLPRPGPFLPCEDLFDWWTLRCGVWAVFLLALLGNGTVVFVLLFSRSRLDVPRFLVANLAAADFFMGLYLGFLAVVDAGTLGEFRAHALAWQMSWGCRLAGFLGVLSSELSVFTLAVITLERNYAITHAMHLNKRLSLRHAACVMAAGWAFALAAATLPLLGVSDYRKFAVCLPFETETPAALGYVVALLAVNGLAFLVLLGCYLKMYCAIRGSQAWNSNDSRIAKRMALLVFTDFLCWSPIAFFALTAAFGLQLVSLEEAKVFTVFVLPLNSCCNPFLYAILTKQFKKDCALVCKAIEESRVTRGIGRCRHSSNFSNRQTPANTNSLNERSSRGQHAPTCACRRLLAEPAAPRVPADTRLRRWLRAVRRRTPAPPARAPRAAQPPARAGSVSSSVEFSSSRSDSWRAGRPPPPRRTASWLVARKTSQDSNLSSSRNDSSGSNATASTGTWRTTRSAASAPASAGAGGAIARPRLTRQPAVLGEEPPSPPAARLLHTIPSAAEPEPPPDTPP